MDQALGVDRTGGSNEPPLHDLHDTQIEITGKWTDRICACTTADCASSVNDGFTQWTVKYVAKPGADDDPLTEEQQAKIAALDQRYHDCVSKLMRAEKERITRAGRADRRG